MRFSEVMAFYDYKMINIVKNVKVARETVKSWKLKDNIPFDKQCIIQVLSGGKLIARKEDDNEYKFLK